MRRHLHSALSLLWIVGPLALVAPAQRGLANDGRDRYQQGVPNLFYHLDQPLAPGAGFRVLPHDQEGGADGEPMFRWAQSVPLAVVEIAARRTVQELGAGALPAALFDQSAENGDTPIDFDPSPSAEHRLRQPPRGRHPGGSHDGGVNLDVGYYLTSVKGQLLAEDLAACTDHYEQAQRYGSSQPRDLNRCIGAANRLDVERQSVFFLELLKLHRERFAGQLLDEIGVDEAVFRLVRQKLQEWSLAATHGAKPIDLRGLEAICTFDRWDGWQKYHHHHTHLRFQPISRTGPLRNAVNGVEREARRIRAELMLDLHPKWPAALDARVLSYQLERSIEVHLVQGRLPPAQFTSVRYRLAGGAWQKPDNADDDQRYLFDLPVGPRPVAETVVVEAEVTLIDASTARMAVQVSLPRQDPRLRVAYLPGTITGVAEPARGGLSLRISYPDVLRALVTSVNYQVYPAAGGVPETFRVDAGWFAADPTPGATTDPKRSRSGDKSLPLLLPRRPLAAISLIEAEVLLAGRLAVSVPVYVDP